MQKLCLEWKVLDQDHVALIFDKPTFAAFQLVAETKGIEPTEMISEAVVGLLGIIMLRPIRT